MDYILSAVKEALITMRIAPAYLAAAAAIAVPVYRARKKGGAPLPGFLEWLLPAHSYRTPALAVDFKLFLTNLFLGLIGIFNAAAVSTGVSLVTISALGALTAMPLQQGAWTDGQALLFAAVIVITSDFGTYWVHRLHHAARHLWPFHAVHHSAEVMTPLTFYRKHPVYDIISVFFHHVLIGAALGGLFFCMSDTISPLGLAGINAFQAAFNFLSANFRHSHVWISFGPALEHVFISPAQHQIHHSRATQHQDKNYGEIFALWDWMFGTLYVPRGREEIAYGLADREGRPLPQPHGTFAEAMAVPFVECIRAFCGRKRGSE